MTRPTFNQAVALWVVRQFPSATPELGSVTFDFGHDSCGYWRLRVDWADLVYYPLPEPRGRAETVSRRRMHQDLENYDEDTLLEEIFDIGKEGSEDEGAAPDQDRGAQASADPEDA